MKKLLNEMKLDERKAPYDYSKLLKQVKTKRAKKIIKGIIRNERKHLRLLKTIKK